MRKPNTFQATAMLLLAVSGALTTLGITNDPTLKTTKNLPLLFLIILTTLTAITTRNTWTHQLKKRKLTSTILTILICTSTLTPIYLLTRTKGEPPPYATPPTTIHLQFPQPTVERKPELGQYVRLNLPDCQHTTTPGHPALPVKVVTVKINRGYEVTDVKATVTHRELGGRYDVAPAPEPVSLAAAGNSTGEKSDHRSPPTLGGGLSKPDPEIYGRRDQYPGKWLDYRVYTGIDPATLTGIKYLVIHFYPLQYAPAMGGVTAAESATLEIEYTGSAEYPDPPSVDLIIITSQTLKPQADSLAEWKNQTGTTTRVVTTGWIYSNYSGRDNPEKIRNYINDTYPDMNFVLIFGDADQVPFRMAYIPDSPRRDPDGDYVETDLYYADLQYSWDDNGPKGVPDGKWGDLDYDEVDGVPDLYAGRLPASTLDEAATLVDKIINYYPTDEWFTRCLLLGTDPFGGKEGEILKDYIQTNFIWTNYTTTKLYETAGNLTVPNAWTEINNGYGLVNFAGHGDDDRWLFEEAGDYTKTESSSQFNDYDTSVIFAMACLTAMWSETDCLGEAFLLNPDGGAIAYYGASRDAWGNTGAAIIDGLAGEMDWRFWEALFDGLNQSKAEEPYAGEAWGIALTRYMEKHDIHTKKPVTGGRFYLDWKTVAEYGTLLGDPTLYLRSRPYEFRGNHITPWPYRYDSTQAKEVLSDLTDAYTSYIGLSVNVYQDSYTSSTVYMNTAMDQALTDLTQEAHERGLEVVWIIFVNSKDGTWRGNIDPTNKAEWFETYRTAVNHYAELADSSQVDLFLVGSELENLKGETQEWQWVIGNVTARYGGKISYNQNWWSTQGEYDAVSGCTWFNELDYIGISAFFELTNKQNPTLAELVAAWHSDANGRNPVADLQGLVTEFNRPILFTEVGYRSLDGTNREPWNWTADGDVDLQEQADCYEALFRVFHNKPWFHGTLFWAWSTNPNEGGAADKGYAVRDKPAEEVLTTWYRRIAHIAPVVVTAFDNERFEGSGWHSKEVEIPDGTWRKILLTYETASVNDDYARTYYVAADEVELHRGVTLDLMYRDGGTIFTMEDVTSYKAILRGNVTLKSLITAASGYSWNVTVKLHLYPGVPIPAANNVTPVFLKEAFSDSTPKSKNVTFPSTQPTKATLVLFASGPYGYTGDVRVWVDDTEIATVTVAAWDLGERIPPYFVDVTDHANLLNGTRTVKVQVVEGTGYWDISLCFLLTVP